MTVNFYKILHLLGAFMVFLAYGGLIVRAVLDSSNASIRRLGAITSGIGMLFILVGGFGLLAKLQYGFPGWIIVKIVIWFILGGMIALINRKPQLAQIWWWLTIILGLVAAVMAFSKPI